MTIKSESRVFWLLWTLTVATATPYMAASIGQDETVIESYRYAPGARLGAICADGSRSDARGRGACSHHGGVSQWITSEVREREFTPTFLSRHKEKFWWGGTLMLLSVDLPLALMFLSTALDDKRRRSKAN